MNTLHYAIILDFQRTKLLNDCEDLNNEQMQVLNDMTDKAYSLITETDYRNMLSENEENTFYTDVKNEVNKVLKEYNLSFFDNRCYSYLYDGVYDMLFHLF